MQGRIRAHGLIDEAGLAHLHAHVNALLARERARLDAVYVCPHHATEGRGAYAVDCECR